LLFWERRDAVNGSGCLKLKLVPGSEFEAAKDTAELVWTRKRSKRLDCVLLTSEGVNMSFI